MDAQSPRPRRGSGSCRWQRHWGPGALDDGDLWFGTSISAASPRQVTPAACSGYPCSSTMRAFVVQRTR